MKVVIAGSRVFNHNEPFYMRELERLVEAYERHYGKITMVVSGCARGPDKLGEQWAKDNDIMIAKFPANWDVNGKAAGVIRNTEMGEFADGAIIMWDGESNGSKHMSTVMAKLRKPFIIDILKVLNYNNEHGPDGKIRSVTFPLDRFEI